MASFNPNPNPGASADASAGAPADAIGDLGAGLTGLGVTAANAFCDHEMYMDWCSRLLAAYYG